MKRLNTLVFFILLFVSFVDAQETKQAREKADFSNPALNVDFLKSATADNNFAQAVLHPDSEPLTFIQSSSYPWVAKDGYVESGNRNVDGTSSWFCTTIENEYEIELTFEWYSVGESYYDFFNFWIDNQLIIHYSGNNTSGFTTWSAYLPAGSYSLNWEYNKDGSFSYDLDAAQIRNLKVHYFQESTPQVIFDIVNGVLMDYHGIGGNVVIPDEVVAIAKYAFYNKENITSITIPESVINIGDYAFGNCYNLQEITVQWPVPLVVSPTVFEGVDKRGCTLNVPENALEAYQADAVWGKFLADSNFEIDDKGVLIAYYGNGGEVVIPTGVTAIANYVFSDNYNLTSIIIPEGVTNIGYGSFANCSNLSFVSIPNSVTSIGDYAFVYCTNLQEIVVEWTTPLSISSSVFEGVNLRNCLLTVPEGSLDAYQKAPVWMRFFSDFDIDESGVLTGYYGNGGEVEIPTGVTAIANYVFSDNYNLTSIIIPEGVTNIGYGAFISCSNLSFVSIPNSVTSIGDYAFRYCYNLQEIVVEWTTPLSISSSVFEGVNLRNCILTVPEGSLEAYQKAPVWMRFFSDFEIDESGVLTGYYGNGGEVEIPIGVTAIAGYVFQNKYNLTSVIIPEGVTSIGYSAFGYCYNLSFVSIPNSVTFIGDYAFEYCINLQEIIVEWTTPLSISSSVFQGINPRNCILTVPEGSLEAYQKALVWMRFFSDFDIDENGILTGYYGNGGEVEIPTGVTAIADYVFYDNYNLTSVVIPEGVTSIGYSAFGYCYYLSFVSIPNSVTSIGDAAFAYCYNLRKITVEWITPLGLWSSDIFYGVDKSNCSLVVPVGTKEKYAAANVWKEFVNIREKGSVSISGIELNDTTVSLKDNTLRINSAVSEKIIVYSVTGNLLFQSEKPAGEFSFPVGKIQDKVLIVKGGSGWTKKIIK
jgi:flagellar hook protein FlgE